MHPRLSIVPGPPLRWLWTSLLLTVSCGSAATPCPRVTDLFQHFTPGLERVVVVCEVPWVQGVADHSNVLIGRFRTSGQDIAKLHDGMGDFAEIHDGMLYFTAPVGIDEAVLIRPELGKVTVHFNSGGPHGQVVHCTDLVDSGALRAQPGE